MDKRLKLPPIKKQKPINIKKFVKLAKRVKAIFEEEEEWLRKHKQQDGDNSRFTAFRNT